MDITPDNSPAKPVPSHRNEQDRNCNNEHAAEGIADVQEELQSRLIDNVGDVQIDLHSKLGHGAFSSVYRGTMKTDVDSGPIAVKCLALLPQTMQAFKNEIKIHKLASGNCNIVAFFDHCVVKDVAYLYFELCGRGEVFNLIQPHTGLPRHLVPPIFAQLVDAVTYLHNKGIAHLDLKPENMLLTDMGRLKLCDFGLSCLTEDGPLYTCRGSTAYAAPENLKCHFAALAKRPVHGYDALKSDVWSVGVVLFVLLHGYTPWDIAREASADYRLYKHTEGYPNARPWNQMATVFRTLFHRMLCITASKRWSIQLVKNSITRDLGWRSPQVFPLMFELPKAGSAAPAATSS
eukprot:TRINITY_DN11276_c0_g1_i1.p2 TRINITY_DN11276_c0_g1~~TRINITY_DN11276_c0_g1_i1.p2  ORF type:complete len:348 (+),score=65.10 TRINITY_DN11276_c0_g1_i1:3239-4282(+)